MSVHILNPDSLGSCLRPSTHFPKVSCGPQLQQFKHFPSYVKRLRAAMGPWLPRPAWSAGAGSCPQIPPGTCWGHWGHAQPFFASDCPLTWCLPAPFGLESSLGKGTGAEKQRVLREGSEKGDISPVLMYVGALCDEKVEEMALSQVETLTSPGF